MIIFSTLFYLRLREGSIMIIGDSMNNIIQEVCKNLSLCGISSLTLKLKSNENSSNLLYSSSSLKNELKEIHPNIKYIFSLTNDITNIDSFDFIIACGHPDLIQYSQINKLAHERGICNLLCFEYAGNLFLFNDFVEFTVNAKNGQKTFSFPSFDDVINSVSSENSKKNYLQESFIESISSKL